MKIKKIKINGFGKLEDRELNFSDYINVIQGKNETGKSTLTKYITSMLYGVSKNKRGKEISDLEKYIPWGMKEYSGTMEYELEDGTEYEIFRDFSKKTVKILNNQKEDISKQFSIDKIKGNEFFYEQTKVDENLYTSSFVSMQEEVKLEEEKQNTLLQKLTNLVSSGEDNISYQKSIDKLSKKLSEEVGSNRTQNRPINLVENRRQEIIKEKEGLKEDKKIEEKLAQERKQKENQLENDLIKYECIKELKQIQEEEQLEKQKIEINKNIEKDLEEKENNKKKEIEELNKKLEENNNIKKEKDKINYKIYFLIFFLLIILNNFSFFILKNRMINIIFGIIDLFYFILFIFQYIKNKKIDKNRNINKNKKLEEINTEIKYINNEIKLIQENKIKKEKEILFLENTIKNKIENKIQEIKSKYNNKIREEEINNIIYSENWSKEFNKIEEIVNEKKLEIHKLQIEQKNIIPRLERIVELEEELEKLELEKEELEEKEKAINLVTKTLQESYMEMKQNVVPKFTQNLSNIIKKISNGKYKSVKIDEKNSLIIEAENRNYIPIYLLSVGTIDQLYLSLRFSILKEITEEKIPIILDETFAYFDQERLKNIFQYIKEELKENQIIIFTCTKREEEILKELNMKFQKIELL